VRVDRIVCQDGTEVNKMDVNVSEMDVRMQ